MEYEQNLKFHLTQYIEIKKNYSISEEPIFNKIAHLLSDYYNPVIDSLIEEMTEKMKVDFNLWDEMLEIIKTSNKDYYQTLNDLFITRENYKIIIENATPEEKQTEEHNLVTQVSQYELKQQRSLELVREEPVKIRNILEEERVFFNTKNETYERLKDVYENAEKERKEQEQMKKEQEESKQHEDEIAKIEQLRRKRTERRNTTIETKL